MGPERCTTTPAGSACLPAFPPSRRVPWPSTVPPAQQVPGGLIAGQPFGSRCASGIGEAGGEVWPGPQPGACRAADYHAAQQPPCCLVAQPTLHDRVSDGGALRAGRCVGSCGRRFPVRVGAAAARSGTLSPNQVQGPAETHPAVTCVRQPATTSQAILDSACGRRQASNAGVRVFRRVVRVLSWCPAGRPECGADRPAVWLNCCLRRLARCRTAPVAGIALRRRTAWWALDEPCTGAHAPGPH